MTVTIRWKGGIDQSRAVSIHCHTTIYSQILNIHINIVPSEMRSVVRVKINSKQLESQDLRLEVT